MRYQICDVEITAPLPRVQLGENETGLAVHVRRAGRPVWFWMEPLAPGTTIEPSDFATRLSARVAAKLLNDSIRAELLAHESPNTAIKFPTLSLAICTKDRPARLARCLESLPREVHEILVIDNAPRDEETRDLVRANPRLRYVREPKPGLDFARNRALAEASGELLAFIDDDVVLDREWLPGLQETWRENPDAAAFTGLILPLELATEAQIMFEQMGGFRGGPGHGFEKIRYGSIFPGAPQYPCDAGMFGAGANMIFRRDVLRGLGGFDEALDTGAPLPGGGDLDIFYRIIRAGYVLAFEPRCLAWHEHRRDLRGLRRQYWSWGLGYMAFAAKSVRADAAQRRRWQRHLAWWFGKYQPKQLVKSLLGRATAPPPEMVFAEIRGALDGRLGGYTRSQRRTARIRARFA